jgi:hypothetical protein
MGDMTKPLTRTHITPRKAMETARAQGLNCNMDTVRRLARHAQIAKRLGGRLFINEQKWLDLLETGHPDCTPPSERTPGTARKNGV